MSLGPNTLRVLGSEPGVPETLWPRFEVHAQAWEAHQQRVTGLDRALDKALEGKFAFARKVEALERAKHDAAVSIEQLLVFRPMLDAYQNAVLSATIYELAQWFQQNADYATELGPAYFAAVQEAEPQPRASEREG